MAQQRRRIWFFAFCCFVWRPVAIAKAAQQEVFKFLGNMKPYNRVESGESKDFNCTTNDPNATVSLWMSRSGGPWKQRELKPGKLIRTGGVFTLLNANSDDASAYRCQAVNKRGTRIRMPDNDHGAYLLFVRVEPPLYEYTPEQPQFRQVGQLVTFTLIATRYRPKIDWKKTIQTQKPGGGIERTYLPVREEARNITVNIKEGKLISTLMIHNLTLQDGGVYTAFGRYRHFQHTEHFLLQVFEPSKPRIYEISPHSVVKESQQTTLKCSAFAYPPADIVWFKDGRKVRFCNARYRRCKNALYEFYYDKKSNWTVSTLTIRKIKYYNAGTYLCRTKNPYGQNYSTTKVFVKSRPVMSNSQKVESMIKRYGIRAKLECRISRGYPLPTFEWLYQRWPCADNGIDSNCRPQADKWRPLPSTIRPRRPVNQQSLLSRITLPANEPPNMAAYYKCKAKNELGEDSVVYEFHRYKTGRLEVLGIEQGQSQSLNAGDTLILQCFVRLGYVAPQSVRWYKGGKELDISNDSRITTKLRPKVNKSKVIGEADQAELILTLTNLTVNDSAIYSCKAAQDQIQMIAVNVKAVKPPKLKWQNRSMEQITVLEGITTTIELRCGLQEGNPKPKFSWFKDGKSISPNKNQLTVPNCKHAKDGMYFSTAGSSRDVILCGDPLKFETFSGRYTCKAENSQGVDEIHSYVEILAAVQITEPKEESDTVFVALDESFFQKCQARGHPPPVMEWRKMEGSSWVRVGKASIDGNVDLEIPSLTKADIGNYSCVATNSHSVMKHYVVLQLDPETLAVRHEKESSEPSLFGPIAGCVAAVLLIVVITILLWRKQKRKISKYSFKLEYSQFQIDPDKAILEQVNDMPYDPDWEFREDRLLLSTVIGSGAFGQVVKAEAMGILAFSARDKTDQAFKRRSKLRRSVKAREVERKPENWKFTKTTVAVKMLKENASESEYRDLASEIKIMIHIGEHPNIINILGACTRSKRLMLIMEYAPHGNLLKFLREKRTIYQPTWKKTISDPNEEFTLADLLMAAYQIARGMEFLASKKCIHRDLAARNVLIGDDYVMKIADFGLARDVYKNDEYVKQTSGLLPVKWMALESLFDRVYTEKSDVWSFGIVLWEIFTLGGTPYPGLPTEHLLDFLSEGKRMGQPHNCPTKVYSLMKDCWILQPECRPSFALLSELLGKFLEKNIRKDNPYIVFSLDEATSRNSYYQFPYNSNRCSARSSSEVDLEAGPSNFEPIESPPVTRKGENENKISNAPAQQSHAVNNTPPEDDLPPSYDEALKLSKMSPNQINQTQAQEQKKMADLSVWLDDPKYSRNSEPIDEGTDMDWEASERQNLLDNAFDDNQNKVQNPIKDNPADDVICVPTNHIRGPRRGRCESEV